MLWQAFGRWGGVGSTPGGSGTFSPQQIVDLYTWFDPGSGMVLGTGTEVATWTDRISSVVLNPSVTFVPTVASTGLNSLPIVANDTGGGSPFLATSAGGYSDTGTDHSAVFLMRMKNGGDAFGRMLSFGNSTVGDDSTVAGSFNFARDNLTTGARIERNSAYSSVSTIGYDTWFIGVVIFDGTNGYLYINGSQVGSSFASTGSFNINKLSIWTASDSAPSSDFGSGKTADIMTIKRAFTSAEREQLEGWLAHRYALTSLLPGGHPYKTSAP